MLPECKDTVFYKKEAIKNERIFWKSFFWGASVKDMLGRNQDRVLMKSWHLVFF